MSNTPKHTSSGDRIVWLCDACGKPIRARQGYLEVDYTEAYNRHITIQAEQRQLRERYDTGHGCAIIPVSAITAHSRVPWQAWHRKCDPNPDAYAYCIAIERINTHQSLIRWAGHLMGKSWINDTTFQDLLQTFGRLP